MSDDLEIPQIDLNLEVEVLKEDVEKQVHITPEEVDYLSSRHSLETFTDSGDLTRGSDLLRKRNWEHLNQQIKIEEGCVRRDGDGNSKVFLISHNLPREPTHFTVLPKMDCGKVEFVSANDHYIKVHFQEAPPTGQSNIKLEWDAFLEIDEFIESQKPSK